MPVFDPKDIENYVASVMETAVLEESQSRNTTVRGAKTMTLNEVHLPANYITLSFVVVRRGVEFSEIVGG